MPFLKRRHFLQLAASTLAIGGLNALNLQQQGLQYARVLAQSTRRKRALLVGINEYPASPLFTNLKGCTTDVELQRELLMHRFGFSHGDIVTLTNQDANRQSILDTFNEFLIKPCQAEDVVVFHFSGHGRRIADAEGVLLPTGDRDALNSTLVPSDDSVIGESGEVTDIMGKTLFLLTSALKTQNVTIVLDSCYAGGGIRGNTRIRSAGERADLRPNRDELDYQQRWLEQALNLDRQQFAELRDMGIAKGIAIAAAQRNQRAVDVSFNGFDAGAFTYFLTQFLWHEAESVESVIAHVTRNLQEESFSQIPLGCVAPLQCDATQTRSQPLPIYFVNPQSTSQVPAEAVIQSVQGDRATIWLGGSDSDSIVAYGTGAEFTPSGQAATAGQTIRVVRREGLTAEVILPAPLSAGTRLQEATRIVPRDVKLRIGLDPSLKQETIAAQQAFQILGDRFELVLPLESETYPGEVQYILSRMTDNYLQLFKNTNQEVLPTETSILLFSPGLDEIIPGSDGESEESVKDAIDRLAAKFNALYAARLMKLALNANSARPNALNVTAEIQIPQGRSTVAQAFTVRGARSTQASTSESLLEMELGAMFQFVVTNREPEDLHVVVLVVDRTGDIDPVLPNAYTASVDETLIRAGQTQTIPAPDSGIELYSTMKGLGEALILVSRNSPRQALLAVRNDQRSSNIPVVDALLADVSGVELSRSGAGDRQVATNEVAGFSIPFRVV